MWSVWLVFCDCGFHFVCPLMDRDKKLMEASWWERLTEGETLFLVLKGRATFSKSLIQFSVDGWGCVPSLLLDLRPNYGGGNEDNGNLLQKVPCTHCYTQCPQPCSRPLQTHVSARDAWTLTGKSGSVSCGVTVPFYRWGNWSWERLSSLNTITMLVKWCSGIRTGFCDFRDYLCNYYILNCH